MTAHFWMYRAHRNYRLRILKVETTDNAVNSQAGANAARAIRGLTLIEVLIALAIVAFSVGALGAAYANSLILTRTAEAQMLARLRLETLLAEG